MSSGEYPVANFGDDEYPRVFERELAVTIEHMAPSEITYAPFDPSATCLLRNPYGQLFLARHMPLERYEPTDPDDPHEGPKPDWDAPFIGIMRIQSIRSDGAVIDGYIVDVRAMPLDFIPMIDFSEIPEEAAETFNASVIRVFGAIREDIAGEMDYISPDNDTTKDAATYLWQYTNSTRPTEEAEQSEEEPINDSSEARQPEVKRKKKHKNRPVDAATHQEVTEEH